MELGIHTFVWNDGQTQADLELAMEKTCAAGYSLLELPGLNPQTINIDRLAQRATQLNLKLAASAGLPPDHDISSADAATVRRGEALIRNKCRSRAIWGANS